MEVPRVELPLIPRGLGGLLQFGYCQYVGYLMAVNMDLPLHPQAGITAPPFASCVLKLKGSQLAKFTYLHFSGLGH